MDNHFARLGQAVPELPYQACSAALSEARAFKHTEAQLHPRGDLVDVLAAWTAGA
jgi:hypothetical protein